MIVLLSMSKFVMMMPTGLLAVTDGPEKFVKRLPLLLFFWRAGRLCAGR